MSRHPEGAGVPSPTLQMEAKEEIQAQEDSQPQHQADLEEARLVVDV